MSKAVTLRVRLLFACHHLYFAWAMPFRSPYRSLRCLSSVVTDLTSAFSRAAAVCRGSRGYVNHSICITGKPCIPCLGCTDCYRTPLDVLHTLVLGRNCTVTPLLQRNYTETHPYSHEQCDAISHPHASNIPSATAREGQERERALLETFFHNGGSRARPGDRRCMDFLGFCKL